MLAGELHEEREGAREGLESEPTMCKKKRKKSEKNTSDTQEKFLFVPKDTDELILDGR